MSADWLTSCGLVPAGEGRWRDEATGLEVQHSGYIASVYTNRSNDNAPVASAVNGAVRAWVAEDGMDAVLSPAAALRFAAALQLAARLAEAYNAQEVTK